ncbi:MAG: RNA polymerase sigma factor [Sedimentisphaerales bacterium]|nr:RNA polymerase sigma factor [Sedimentisphaerales bacterium]
MMVEKRQNELALVLESQKGNKDALQQLIIRNWAWVKGLVYNIIYNSSDVDDCLQDICLKLINKIDTLREPERFKPWLAVLARREALRHRQQKSKRPLQLDEELIESKQGEKDEFFENIIEKEKQSQILMAIHSLPEKYREVFIMQHSGDLTYNQISEILDVPVTTVQIRLVRARKMVYEKIINNDKDKVLEQ